MSVRVSLVFLILFSGSVGLAQANPLTQGEYLTRAAGCLGCHTEPAKAGQVYAGGRALDTPFGRFFSPNITADLQTGIGGWSDDDFIAALAKGQRPDGSQYFPIFPFTSYTKMTRQDMLAIKQYLFSLPKVVKQNKPHDVAAPFSWRWLQAGWKMLFFSEGEAAKVEGRDENWHRGRYLADAVLHCSECHTPRNRLGVLDSSQYLAGSNNGPEGKTVANITPHKGTGIGGWTKPDVIALLKEGMLPDFDNVQGSMEEVVTNSSSHLTAADLDAIAAYLLSLPPVENKIGKTTP
jgi:mono/diheme cytochrome c family protein